MTDSDQRKAGELIPDDEGVRGYIQAVSSYAVTLGVVASQSLLFTGLAGGLVTLMALHATHGQKRKVGRLEELIDKVEEEVAKLDDSKVDRDWLGTEEHEDLLREALHAAGRARSEEQLQLYAKILVGAVVPELREKFDIEAFLALLAALTPHQVEILRIIWNLQCELTVHERTVPDPTVTKHWRKRALGETVPEQLLSALDAGFARLRQLGLVEMHFNSASDRPTYPLGVPVFTDLTRRLMCLVNHEFDTEQMGSSPWDEEAAFSNDLQTLKVLVEGLRRSPIVDLDSEESVHRKSGLDEVTFIQVLYQLEMKGDIKLERFGDGHASGLEAIHNIRVTPRGLDRYLRFIVEDAGELAVELCHAAEDRVVLHEFADERSVALGAVQRIAERLDQARVLKLFPTETAMAIRVNSDVSEAEIRRLFSPS